MPTITLAPQQDGRYQGWSSVVGKKFAYLAISELVSDGDSTYFILPRIILPAGRASFPLFIGAENLIPTSIQITVTARRHTGVPQIRIGFAKSGATIFDGTVYAPASSFFYDTGVRTFSTNPFTGSAWVASDLANLEVCLQMNDVIIANARITKIACVLVYEIAQDLYPPEPQMMVN